MKQKKLDTRILEFLKKKGYESEEEINKFLNPSINNLNNPFLLDGMAEAKTRIEEAINNKENKWLKHIKQNG